MVTRRPRIVAADDDQEWLELLSFALRAQGYRLFPARSAKEALEQVRRHRPDCIVLDYDLGDQTALQVSSSIKSASDLASIPIIVLTAHAEEKLRSYRDCQADHFVLKDGETAELVTVIESMLRRLEWDRGVIKRDDVQLTPETCSVLRDDQRIRLSPEQFSFFRLLVQRSPQPVTSQDVFRLILREHRQPEDTDAIRSLAHRTRQALGEPLSARIKSIKGFGWVYVKC